jgi:hypothetical protein
MPSHNVGWWCHISTRPKLLGIIWNAALYLNVYVPRLQREGGVAAFFRFHRGHLFASSALMDPISKEFVARVGRFAKQQRVPVVQFRKGERKDDDVWIAILGPSF